MSDREDMGFPKRPDGVEDNGANGHDAPTPSGIVPIANASQVRSSSPSWTGYVMCAVGGAATSFMPVLSGALVGFGVLTMAGKKRSDLPMAIVTCLVAAVVAGVVTAGIASIESIASCVLALAVAVVVTLGLMGPGPACLIVAVGTALILGADSVMAALAGSSITEMVSGVVDAYVSTLETTPETSAVAPMVREMMGTYWPLSFVILSIGTCLFSWIGATLAIRSRGIAELYPRPFFEFDLPLWPVAVLVAAILGAALGQGLGQENGALVSMVSLNTIMSLRFAFAIQGFAVLTWFVGTRRIPAIIAIVLTFAAFYLEMRFIIMSIVGLADIWLNFRRLRRGAPTRPQGAQQQE